MELAQASDLHYHPVRVDRKISLSCVPLTEHLHYMQGERTVWPVLHENTTVRLRSPDARFDSFLLQPTGNALAVASVTSCI